MQKDYTAALSDMNLYLSNSCSKYKTLTEANISSWAASVADYDPKNPTPKKPLNPAFEIDQTQEGRIPTRCCCAATRRCLRPALVRR